MAELLRGRGGGDTVRVHQYCNDWFSVILSDGRTKIVSPTSLQFDESEAEQILEDITLGRVGMMELEFDFDPVVRRFRRKSMR